MRGNGVVAAWEAFQFAQWSYRVTIVGAQMVASADLGQIDALLRMSRGFGSARALHDDAEEIRGAAEGEVERSFATLRKFVVISACSAMEGLWKAAFVEQALRDPSILAGLDVRIQLSPADVIGVSDEEKLFALADELYKTSPGGRSRQKTWTHFERHLHLVSNLLLLSTGEVAAAQEWLEMADAELYNEIFAVRNCLVHNGGVADRRLEGRGTFEVGSPIVLTPRLVDDYLANLEYVGTAYVHKIWLEISGEGDG